MASKNRNKAQTSKFGGLSLEPIEPLTASQKKVFDSDKNVVESGAAGTGKTFISSYLGLKSIMNDGDYARLVYIRSAVSTRDIGFLPGTEKEKMEVYERPYIDIMCELFDRGDAYDILKRNGTIHFMPTSFVRGTTLRDAVVIVDECQNMTYHELDSIITRIGDNCRVFFCGDFNQSDLRGNGIKDFYSVLKRMNSFEFVEFNLEDIVRSDFVKEYLITKYEVHGDKQLS